MKAGLDIGNTRSKLGLYHEDGRIEVIGIDRTVEALTSQIEVYGITDLIVSSVSGALVDDVDWMHRLETFIWLSHHTPLPISLDYSTPETLGRDRIALAVGAYHLLPKEQLPALIIDAGTCMTMDILDQNHCFKGGVISPGIQMRLRAMNNFTDALPLVDLDDWTGPLGNSTKEAVLLGAAQGAVCEIEGFAGLLENEFSELNVILTGGDGPMIAKKLQRKIFLHPELLHIGLRETLKFNAN